MHWIKVRAVLFRECEFMRGVETDVYTCQNVCAFVNREILRSVDGPIGIRIAHKHCHAAAQVSISKSSITETFNVLGGTASGGTGASGRSDLERTSIHGRPG